MLLQSGQPLCRGVEIDDALSRRIEEEERIVRLAEQAACDLELAFFGVHDQSGPQPGNVHAAVTRRGTDRICASLVSQSDSGGTRPGFPGAVEAPPGGG